MIYLFNSAYRSKYQENLLATLFLPYGWTNEYRYRCSPQRRNVSEGFTALVEELQGKEEAVIIFINRFGKDRDGNDAYEYYPIRKARFLSCREDGQQLYARVQLLDFIFPTDIDYFTQQLIEKLSPKNLPKLTNNNPKEENDGYYAIYADSIFDDKSKYISGDNAWDNCVTTISKTKKLKSSIRNQVVFARSKLCEHAREEKVVRPHITNNPWYQVLLRRVNDGDAFYKLTKNRRYDFRINYVYPIQEQDTTVTAKMKIKVSGNISPLGSQELLINSRADRIAFSFIVNEPIEERVGTLEFAFSPDTVSAKMVAPQRDMSFQIGHSRSYWLALIISVILFVLGGTFIGTYSAEKGLLNIFAAAKSDWPKIIAAIVQAMAIYWLFRLTGRKLL